MKKLHLVGALPSQVAHLRAFASSLLGLSDLFIATEVSFLFQGLISPDSNLGSANQRLISFWFLSVSCRSAKQFVCLFLWILPSGLMLVLFFFFLLMSMFYFIQIIFISE